MERNDTNLIILQGKIKSDPKYTELRDLHKLELTLESISSIQGKDTNFCYAKVEILGDNAKYLSPYGEGKLKNGDTILIEGMLSSSEAELLIQHVSTINIISRVDTKTPNIVN